MQSPWLVFVCISVLPEKKIQTHFFFQSIMAIRHLSSFLQLQKIESNVQVLKIFSACYIIIDATRSSAVQIF